MSFKSDLVQALAESITDEDVESLDGVLKDSPVPLAIEKPAALTVKRIVDTCHRRENS